MLSPAGTRGVLIHVAARTGTLQAEPQATADDEITVQAADQAALGQLATALLITFSLDRGAVTADRLVLYAIRDHLENSAV